MPPSLDHAHLERAVFKTLAYADVFDYPMTAGEIQRYLVGEEATLADVQETLRSETTAGKIIERNSFYSLPGRQAIFETRLHRSKRAFELWPKAIAYGDVLARLPFVSMVAVTGSLAVDNEPACDIDYLIVTKPRRLWLCRGMVILVVFWARTQGLELCPNYLISENALALKRRDLYVAHEIAQMVPLSGLPVYWRVRELNRWTDQFLPNGAGVPRPELSARETRSKHALTRLAEWLLYSRPAGWLEKWEMRRKIRKFQRRMSPGEETEFSADLCKGHFGEYGKRTLAVYYERLGET